MIRLEPVTDTPPAGFDAIRRDARAERYNMLDRLASEWESGEQRFTRPGEALLAAYSENALAGIGGVTVEPSIAGAFRMRRFYVRPPYRRLGIARRLALALLEGLPSANRLVTVNAAPGSEAFWEALGFAPVTAEGWTHLLT